MTRDVVKVVKGSRAVDGAGVNLVRVIGARDVRDFDPFLMLDAFDSTNPEDYVAGFPWHPHRGIETVTFLAEGKIEHGDSLGNRGVITDGGCQWMTAGSGIIHEEMPKPSPRMLGLQLWLNLPAADKMTSPTYSDLPPERIPTVTESGATVRVIAGEYCGTQGAAKGGHVDMRMLEVTLEPGTAWSLPTPQDDTVMLYVLEGGCLCGEQKSAVEHHSAVLLSRGDRAAIQAGGQGAHFVLFEGKPLREPVAWGGPIVMNTEEELRQAFAELRNGTFLRSSAH